MPRSLTFPTLSILKALAYLHIIGGIVLALLWWLPRFHPVLLTTLYMHNIPNQPPLNVFGLCLLGPTVASWGVLCRLGLDYLVHAPSQRAYRGLLLAIWIWAPLDTAMCLSQGIMLAAIANISMIILFSFLLHRLWQQLKTST